MSYKRKVEVQEPTADKPFALVVVTLLDDAENELRSNSMLLSAANQSVIDAELVKLSGEQDELEQAQADAVTKKVEIEQLYPGIAVLEIKEGIIEAVPPELTPVELTPVEPIKSEDQPAPSVEDIPIPEMPAGSEDVPLPVL